jgi:hypothetical protein
MSFDTNTSSQSSLFEKTEIKKINEVSSSLSSIIKQNSQLTGPLENKKKQPEIIKNGEFKQLNERDHQNASSVSLHQQTISNKPPLYMSKNISGEKKGVYLLKNKGLKLNSSFIDTNVNATIIQSKYSQTTVGSLPIMNNIDNIKQNYLNIPTNNYENKQPLFQENNYHTKHHHHHHHHRNKKIKEKRWGGGGGRSITLSHDGSEFIHKHNDNIIDPKDYEKNTTKSENINIVVTEEKEDYSNVHPLSLIMENLTCYPSYHSYDSHNEKSSNKKANPDLLSLKKDDAVAIQHFFPDGWAFGYHPASGESGMFPLKCLQMAESGGTGIVIFPPTEADLLMAEIKDNITTENAESLKDKENTISEKKSDNDNFNNGINIYNEMEFSNKNKHNEIELTNNVSFTSPIPIPSSSKSVDYENSLSSSYLSSSTFSNNHSSSSLTSSSSLSSSSLNSLESNQAVYSPPTINNAEFNPNNPFSNNYKNRNYWMSESISPKSAPTFLNYKNDKSFSAMKRTSLLLSNNNTKSNTLNHKTEKEEKDKFKNKNEESKISIKNNLTPINQDIAVYSNEIDKITYDLSSLTLNEKSLTKNLNVSKNKRNNENNKNNENSNSVFDEKENSKGKKSNENNTRNDNLKNDSKEEKVKSEKNEVLPLVKPTTDTSVEKLKEPIIIKPIISPSSSFEKALPIFTNNSLDKSLPLPIVSNNESDSNEVLSNIKNDPKEEKNESEKNEIVLPLAKPTIDTSVEKLKEPIIIKPIISPSSTFEKALPIFTDNSSDNTIPLPIVSSNESNSNELPLLSTRTRRRRQRKDISDCNEFLKNRLQDPTLPIHIRKRYQYYIDNNL